MDFSEDVATLCRLSRTRGRMKEGREEGRLRKRKEAEGRGRKRKEDQARGGKRKEGRREFTLGLTLVQRASGEGPKP